jgi:hypothetical protein
VDDIPDLTGKVAIVTGEFIISRSVFVC